MLDKNRELTHRNGQLVAKVESQQTDLIAEKTERKQLAEQHREKVERILLDKERVRELEQSLMIIEEDLTRERELKQEYEQLLKQGKGSTHNSKEFGRSMNLSESYLSDKRDELA